MRAGQLSFREGDKRLSLLILLLLLSAKMEMESVQGKEKKGIIPSITLLNCPRLRVKVNSHTINLHTKPAHTNNS